jgi:hypothetical protein
MPGYSLKAERVEHWTFLRTASELAVSPEQVWVGEAGEGVTTSVFAVSSKAQAKRTAEAFLQRQSVVLTAGTASGKELGDQVWHHRNLAVLFTYECFVAYVAFEGRKLPEAAQVEGWAGRVLSVLKSRFPEGRAAVPGALTLEADDLGELRQKSVRKMFWSVPGESQVEQCTVTRQVWDDAQGVRWSTAAVKVPSHAEGVDMAERLVQREKPAGFVKQKVRVVAPETSVKGAPTLDVEGWVSRDGRSVLLPGNRFLFYVRYESASGPSDTQREAFVGRFAAAASERTLQRPAAEAK